MWAFFARPEPAPEVEQNNLLRDILRLIRDILAVANDCMPLTILTQAIELMDEIIRDATRAANPTAA